MDEKAQSVTGVPQDVDRSDWRSESVTRREQAAYDYGFSRGVRRGFYLASLIAGCGAVAVIALFIRAFQP